MDQRAKPLTPVTVRLAAEMSTLQTLETKLGEVMQLAGRIQSCINNTIHDLGHAMREVGVTEVEVRAHIFDPVDTMSLVSLEALQAELGICRGTLYKVRRSPDFPKPVHVSGRRKAYLRADIKEWVRNGGLRGRRELSSHYPEPQRS